jgi:hypothetical protein
MTTIEYNNPTKPIAAFHCPAMSEDEKLIAAALVLTALKSGYAISVNDGECFTVKKSRDMGLILGALGTTEADQLVIRNAEDSKQVGWVHLVYGNSPDELVCDYTTGDKMEALVHTVEGLNRDRDPVAYDDAEWARKCAVDILTDAGIRLS